MQETKLRTAISALVAGTVISLGLIATGSPSFAKDNQAHAFLQRGIHAQATTREALRAINRSETSDQARAVESLWSYPTGGRFGDDGCDLPSSACWNDNRITN
jgi:hypothetical protein